MDHNCYYGKEYIPQVVDEVEICKELSKYKENRKESLSWCFLELININWLVIKVLLQSFF
jgi:hypothetical protein